jgi:hypothetical protein
MGMFDEADEITLPFGSLHQFQTILNVMENQELVLKDEPNRLSQEAEQDGRFLRDPCGRFHRSEDEMVGMYAYTTFIEMAEALEVTESIDYTTTLVDETMTVNKNFGKDAIFRGNAIDATSPLIDLGSRSRRSRVILPTRELSWRSRLSRRIRDGMYGERSEMTSIYSSSVRKNARR